MEPVERAILMLTRGMSEAEVRANLEKAGAEPAAAGELVDQARRRLLIAADFNRDKELGKAILRLEDLYRSAQAEKNLKISLAVQREMNRLLGLAQPGGAGRRLLEAAEGTAGGGDDAQAVREQIDLIGKYLVPLGLVDAAYPVTEHARAAAETIRCHGLSK